MREPRLRLTGFTFVALSLAVTACPDRPTQFADAGTVARTTTSAASTVSGLEHVKFRKGTVRRFPKGSIRTGALEEDATVQGIDFKGGKGRRLHFYRNGKVKSGTLARNSTIDGITLKQGTEVSFHDNGRLFVGILGVASKVGQADLKAGTHVVFNKEGQFAGYSWRLTKDTEKQKIVFRSGRVLHFYPDGRVQRGTLVEDTTIDGIRFTPKGAEITFHPNGRVAGGRLAADTVISGIEYKTTKYSTMDFYEDGQVASGVLAKDTRIQGILFPRVTDIKFNEKGRLTYANTTADAKIGDIVYRGGCPKSGCPVRFYDTGQVASGTLAADTVIDGQKRKAGDEVRFDPKGRLRL